MESQPPQEVDYSAEREEQLLRELEELRRAARIRELQREINLARQQADQVGHEQQTGIEPLDTSFDQPSHRASSDHSQAVIDVPDNPDLGTIQHRSRTPVGETDIVQQPRQDELAQQRLQLRFFNQLSDPGSDGAELLLLDMSLQELYEFADAVKAEPQDTSANYDLGQLHLYAKTLYRIFERTNEVADLQPAIKTMEDLISATESGSENHMPRLRDLIVMLFKKYERTHDLEYLDSASYRAIEMIFDSRNTDRGECLADLARIRMTKTLHTGSSEDYEETQMMFQQLFESSEMAKQDLARNAIQAFGRVQRTGDLGDLNEAIKFGQQALDAISDDHPERAAMLGNLNLCLTDRFQRTGYLGDLNNAISYGKQALDAIPQGHSYRVNMLTNLCSSLRFRSQQTGDLGDLDNAINLNKQALDTIADDHASRPNLLGNLGVLLSSRFDQTGNLGDLNEAIKHEQVVDHIPYEHPDRKPFLQNLASSLIRRFQQTGNLDDLNEAIIRGQQALDAKPEDHPCQAGLISNLSSSLMRRFERTGDLSDLNKAIVYGQQALDITPNDHSDRTGLLANLGVHLLRRFHRTGDLDDLNRAIIQGEQAADITPPYHQDLTVTLSNLSAALINRFNRTGNPDDLNQGIYRGQQAVDASPSGHRNQGNLLNNLSISLRTRFKSIENLSDLEQSISYGRQAVDATPHDDPHRAARLSTLSLALMSRFKCMGDLNSLNDAIGQGQQAIDTTPCDHQDRAGMLENMVARLVARYGQTGNLEDLNQAISCGKEAVNQHNAPPQTRIYAAKKTMHLCVQTQNWMEANTVAETAVKLLPTVSPRALSRHDQQDMLKRFAGLATEATSIALEAGKDASHAATLLDLGRGVITGLQFGARTDITALREQHPELADKFERLREILDSPSSVTISPQLLQDPMTSNQSHRHDASLEFDETILEIRQLTNFENFMLPPPAGELMKAASKGPLVLINVSQYRSDAFLVETDGIRQLSLPLLQPEDITSNIKTLRSIRSRASSHDAHIKMAAILEWLWDVLACPILDALGFRGPPSNDNWPHLWWIPTGLLSMLPLHAAGRHYPGCTETVLDRVVSSYSSSIKALIYTHQNSSVDRAECADKAVLISMSTTEGCSDLPFAQTEVQRLDRIIPRSISRVTLDRPGKDAVLEALDNCTFFHFAGHGESNTADPSQSGLLLRGGRETPLAVQELTGLNLSRSAPRLAYLSACSTGESQVDDLQDEALHLISAFQLAGFQHVVGALWEVSDRYSVNLAEQVYQVISQDDIVQDTRTAWAVHNAVRSLRDSTSQGVTDDESSLAGGSNTNTYTNTSGQDARTSRRVRPADWNEADRTVGGNPLVWAPYIHVGL